MSTSIKKNSEVEALQRQRWDAAVARGRAEMEMVKAGRATGGVVAAAVDRRERRGVDASVR